jgi:hypothetical protein
MNLTQHHLGSQDIFSTINLTIGLFCGNPQQLLG